MKEAISGDNCFSTWPGELEIFVHALSDVKLKLA
jgi:hypothetical protein